jgi:predicted RNA-binding protein with TRAM domain
MPDIFQRFRGTLTTWDQLFNQAAEFATSVGSQYVVGISHSADRGDGVVTVWYWTPNAVVTNPDA